MITYNSTYLKKLSKDVSEVEKVSYQIPESFVKDGTTYTYQAGLIRYANPTNSNFISVKDYLFENLKDKCKLSTEETSNLNKTKLSFSSFEPLTKDINIVKTIVYEVPNCIFKDGKFLSLNPSKHGYTDRYNKDFISIKNFVVSSIGKNPFQEPRKDSNEHYRKVQVTLTKSKALTQQIKELSEITLEIPGTIMKDGKLFIFSKETGNYLTTDSNKSCSAKEFIRDSIRENKQNPAAKQPDLSL